jgi:hypothetical protein
MERRIKMKKTIVLFAATSCTTLIAHASDLSSPTIFYDLHYSSYREPGVMTVNSKLPAITVGYRNLTAIREQKGFGGGLSFNLEGTLGYTEYRGSGTHTNNFYKFIGEVYTPLTSKLYVGLGYRHLLDDFGPGLTSTNYATYERLSQYLYLPIGAVLKAENDTLMKVQFNYFVGGRQTSYLTQVIGYYNDAINKQDSGYGLDFSVTTPKADWEFYLRYWNIGRSNLVQISTSTGARSAYEPNNNTVEIGVRKSF